MEFWGVEVKSGEPLTVSPGDGMILHLSQACIGEVKKEKGNEAVYLFVNIDGKRLVLGTLFAEKLPQQQFDLVFDRDFELSHNFKSASILILIVFLNSVPLLIRTGTEGESDEFDSEEEEDNPLPVANNDKSESKPKQEKPESSNANAGKGKESDGGKQKVKIVEPKKDTDAEEDEESTDEDFMSDDEDDSDSQDGDESDESDEETPKKAEPSKKRPVESATKTPVQSKKAKATPQGTDGKKPGGHVDTPHPAKQAGKTPANKPNQQTPKPGGSHSCKSCNRTFTSEQGLESHTKAKHAGGK
ncbi:histone deacetylase HDT1 [Striga asiatica]|uniref:Histone deacetylase HDT1 n=1 Tax=Striga asiatica TaxID=4170 RepID=A0A5A7RCD1_STRAF|nr:histone deacetylase HDT1 [Striga asiatica]